MKIHFSNINFSSNSGPNSFASRLAEELTVLGHQIVTESENYESMLIFIEPASKPKPGARVVHRLDGIWFKPDQFHNNNKLIKWAYDHSDFIVWQSNFDKNMTEHHWGKRVGSVIHNGINIKKYEVDDPVFCKIRDTYENIFVCSSNWHRQKRLSENTALYFQLRQTYPSSCLIVMGANPTPYVRSDHVIYTGTIKHEDCLKIFSMADWMIHLAWLDHCPNVVVEALSQNCPVICTDSGGTHEIVKKNGIVISENRQYNFELTDYDDPYELHIPSLELSKVKVDNTHLDIKIVAQKYVRALSRITQ
jgi:glycosyltransferase involved in cell wall biosynthesis